MDQLGVAYQNAVDYEIDRLVRLSPSELMQIKPGSWTLNTEHGSIELAYLIYDGGDVRRIAVVAERPVALGVFKRKFAGALKVKLSCERLSEHEVADLYD